MVQGQIDVNDPSSHDVAFGTLFFLPLNHWSALAWAELGNSKGYVVVSDPSLAFTIVLL